MDKSCAQLLLLVALAGVAVALGGCATTTANAPQNSGSNAPPVIGSVSSSNPTSNSASITWTTDKPADSQVEYGTTTAYGNLTPVNAALVTSHVVALANLQPGTTYHYRVKSKDQAGTLATSGDFSFTTAASPPDTPPVISGVASSNVTISGATISWLTDKVADSQVEYGTTTAYGSLTPVNAALVTSHAVALANLQAGTTYHYRVKSKDQAGTLATSGDFTFTTTAPPDTPPVISGVASSNITTSGATISWLTDKVADSQVEYGTTTAYGNLTPVNAALVTSHTVALANLQAGTTYHYRVKSKDQAGTLAASGDFTFTTAAPPDTPPVISGVASSSLTTSGATISWLTDKVADSQVEYGTTTAYGNLTPVNAALVTSHAVALANLQAGTTYHYRVKSKDQAGTLATSGDFSFTTAASPPDTPPVISGVTSSNITTSGATISWLTDKVADSQVEYGTTTAYGNLTPVNAALVTSHTVALANLQVGTTYHYRVKSKDQAGTLATSGDFTLTTAVAGTGNTFFVDKNFASGCSDTFPGTAALPWCTIGNSAKFLQPGDTVVVKAGIYNEQVTPVSGTSNATVTYQGQPGAVVDGTGKGTSSRGFNVDGKSFLKIAGFEVRNFTNQGFASVGIFNNANHIELANLVVHDGYNGIIMQNDSNQITIHDCEVYLVRYGVGFEDTVHDVFINNVISHSNRETNIGPVSSYGNGDGFSADSGTFNIFITNSAAYDNLDGGFDMTTSNFSCTNCVSFRNVKYGFRLQAGGPSTLINSLAFGNGWFPLQIDSGGNKFLYGSTFAGESNDAGSSIETQGSGSSNLVIRNCIFTDFSSGVFTSPPPFLDEDFNIFHSATSAAGFPPGPHSLTGDPRFVNPAAGNYQLQAASPARDSGTALPQTNPDLGGTPRPQGAGYDMGAYEFVAAPPADNRAPMVSAVHRPLSPLSPSTQITILALAYDANGVQDIEIFVDGSSRVLCPAATICSLTATFNTSTHTYFATAKDPASNAGRDPASGVKSFTVQ